jgi:hypothetical protein
MPSTLSRSDYENFLIQALLGERSVKQPLLACADRAYLDFSRTLHGFRELQTAKDLRRTAGEALTRKIGHLAGWSRVTQSQFDDWHREACDSLIERYGSFPFHAGQAQKWINMTFKYIYTLGEERISGYSKIYEFCHAPIDNIVIERLTREGMPKLRQAWSRIDYDEYLRCQQWIRDNFEVAPLDVEFRAWQKPKFGLTTIMRISSVK